MCDYNETHWAKEMDGQSSREAEWLENMTHIISFQRECNDSSISEKQCYLVWPLCRYMNYLPKKPREMLVCLLRVV